MPLQTQKLSKVIGAHRVDKFSIINEQVIEAATRERADLSMAIPQDRRCSGEHQSSRRSRALGHKLLGFEAQALIVDQHLSSSRTADLLQAPNENKMSDGGWERALVGVEIWKASRK
jgi:hypothetical protein